MAIFLEAADLTAWKADLSADLADQVIADVEASAIAAAKCILSPDFTEVDAVVAILRRAARRLVDSGSGALQSTSKQIGPFMDQTTFDTRTDSRAGVLTRDEKAQLRQLCGGRPRAFSIDLTPPVPA